MLITLVVSVAGFYFVLSRSVLDRPVAERPVSINNQTMFSYSLLSHNHVYIDWLVWECVQSKMTKNNSLLIQISFQRVKIKRAFVFCFFGIKQRLGHELPFLSRSCGDFYALTHVGMCACVPLAGVTYQRIFVCVSDLNYTQSAN